MVVLQRRLVRIEDGKLGLCVNVEAIVAAVVANIMRQGRRQHAITSRRVRSAQHTAARLREQKCVPCATSVPCAEL